MKWTEAEIEEKYRKEQNIKIYIYKRLKRKLILNSKNG